MKRFLNTADSKTNDKSVIKYRTMYLNLYRKLIRHAKRYSVQKEISKFGNSSKAIWRVANKHRNTRSDTCGPKLLLKVNNRLVDDPQEIVEIFSEQFGRGTVPYKLNSSQAIAILEKWTPKVERELRWKRVTPFEIKKIVDSMEPKKSCGYDDIPITIIKRNIDLLAGPLSELFNICFSQNVFPDELKIAKVIPIYKKGIKTDPKNYRPISLLPVLSKIFEKLIKVRLLNHLNGNHVLNERQFGYQHGVGTIEALE